MEVGWSLELAPHLHATLGNKRPDPLFRRPFSDHMLLFQLILSNGFQMAFKIFLATTPSPHIHNYFPERRSWE
jgi:hypothetical protein